MLDMCVDRRHVAPAFLALAQGAFTTDWISATASDEDVLDLARKLDRVLLTEDTDFGDLIFRDALPPPPGIILSMTSLIDKAERSARFAALAPAALSVALGHFVVVGPTSYRYRPFPPAP